MRKFINTLVLLVVLPVSAIFSSEILKDDFENGNFEKPVAWQVIKSPVTVQKGKQGGSYLEVSNGGKVLSPAFQPGQEYTVTFRGSVSWSAPGSFIFLYQDDNNYYAFGLGARSHGVFRKYQGKLKKLKLADPLGSLILPHRSWAAAVYKVHIKRTEKKLLIEIDKGGDDVDFDTRITESDPAIIAAFTSNRFGFACDPKGGKSGFTNVAVVTGRLGAAARKGITYYVDCAKGDDKRPAEQATKQATPWKSIQKAAAFAKAGDTVLVAGGVYRETITPIHRGGIDSPITFKAMTPKNRPVVSGAKIINSSPWEQVQIKDFNGKPHTVFRTRISWVPAMLYQHEKPLMLAQEPNQVDARDPFDLQFFRKVAKQFSDHELKDPIFLIQPKRNYWKGANLLLYDSSPNFIDTLQITGYDPQTHALQIKPSRYLKIGSKRKGIPDRWALQNHLSLLDQPGEYYIDRSTKPKMLYAIPYPGLKPTTIIGAFYKHCFDFSKGRENIVVDGFVVEECASHGIALGRNANHISIKNCKVIRNMNSGIAGRFVNDIVVKNCLLQDNRDNGTNFSNCKNIQILQCEISKNGDNGVWFGSGQTKHWNSENILVRSCYLHHTTARRRHPDNYQMHQCRSVILENNIFLQEGEQNMWIAYSDNLILRNNIFIGGDLGINATINSYIYHNVFWKSLLRYDAHLTDHPQNKDYYKPENVIIRNNTFVNSSIMWPAAKIIDRFKVFSIDHNYYCIENAYGRSRWEFNGFKLSLGANSLIVTNQKIPAANGKIQVTASVIWSNAGGLIILYQNPKNYYWLGLGKKRGFYRILNDQETCLFKDENKQLSLPHKRNSLADYNIALRRSDGGITFTVKRTMKGKTNKVVIKDDSPSASHFQSGSFGVSSPPGNKNWCSISKIRMSAGIKKLYDDFNDRDLSQAATAKELTWKIINGSASIMSLGGSGIGYGKGSITKTSLKDLVNVFKKLPDKHGEGFNFQAAPGSPLIDAGVDVGVNEDMDGNPRPNGKAPDIGPYEH